MALKHQSQRDHSVHKTGEPQNLKNIIHDINNSLMLIGIAVDELERHASGRQSMKQMMPSHKGISSGNASQIARRHIKQIGAMLQEATHHASNAELKSSQKLELLSDETLAVFFEFQRQEWSLIAPPETKISLSIAPFEGVVLASRTHMMRLFQNLVRNACEAYHNMADKQHALCLSLIVRPHQQGLAFEFTDNGPGMDDTVAEQIFLPHFTTKQQAGLPKGLGLSNANELAQMMGGTLTLAYTNAKGSAFVLNLPYMLSAS